MKDKTSLVILFGGESSEHEVSCVSAASLLEHVDKEKYHINTIGITKEGNWFLTRSPIVNIDSGLWEKDKNNKKAFIVPDKSVGGVMIQEDDKSFSILKADVIFPVLHGRNGEDGTIQGLLQLSGIPFVGSGAAASSASMDKAITKAIINQSSIVDQAKSLVVYKSLCEKDADKELDSIEKFFDCKFPLFVKPANAGSSVGISKVKTSEALPEIEGAVLGNEYPEASCIGEIFAANEFYDYNAKYENNQSKTAIVKDLTAEKEAEIRSKAVRIYQAMGCEGLARVDFFLQEDGRVVFNELNTLPGFTHISMYPKLWEASGIPYDKLIDRLITLALEKYHG